MFVVPNLQWTIVNLAPIIFRHTCTGRVHAPVRVPQMPRYLKYMMLKHMYHAHMFWTENLGLTLADREVVVNGKWLTENLILDAGT